MRGLRGAVGLLTRVPAGATVGSAADLASSVPWFPVVGALVGLVSAAAYAAALALLPPFVAATVAIGVGAAVTGALHEDGLADTADGLGAATQDDATRILRDAAHGTYGVLAVVLSVLVRIGALASLDAWSAAAVLPGAHALGRVSCARLLEAVEPAGEGGLGAAFASALTRREIRRAVGAGLLIGAASIGAWVVPGAVLAVSVSVGVGEVARRRFGGVTGDVLGAAEQLTEISVLLLGAAAVANAWPSPAWWR